MGHDRGTGRTGEAGEPGEAFLGRRHVFVLMAVGARNDEAVESASFQFGAQRGQPARARVTFVRVVECLEAGLEHRGNLWGVFVRSNRAEHKVAWKAAARFIYVQCNITALLPVPIVKAR